MGSSIEASYLMQHGSFYYLFVNYGVCCSGVDSTYNIRMGRSTSPTGPFYDQNGVNMNNSGGTMFLQANGNQVGPGQFGYLSTSSQDYFSYHYYDGNQNGAPQLGLNKLYWINDWPSSAPVYSNWAGAGGASWGAGGNWASEGLPTGAIPSAVDNIANFGFNSVGGYNVSLGSVQTVTTINFTGSIGYVIGTTNGLGITLTADSGAAAMINVADDGAAHVIAAPVTATSTLAVNIQNSDASIALNGTVTAPLLQKYGFGTLLLGAGSTISTSVLVHQGAINLAGSLAANQFTSIGVNAGDTGTLSVHGSGSFTANADFNVGDTGDGVTAAAGTLNLSDRATVTVNSAGGFYVGSGFFAGTNANGLVNQTGGTLNANGNFDGAFIIGGRASALAVGMYNLSGGTVNANTNVRVGGYGVGTLNQTGGNFNTPTTFPSADSSVRWVGGI